jgi:protein-disulfide isomerase
MLTTIRVPGSALIIFLLGACSSAAQPAATAQTPETVVATIDGTPITLAEVDQLALRRRSADYGGLTLLQAMYEARKSVLEEMIATRLIDAEAGRLGIDGAALAEKEIVAKIQEPTEADISAWYAANKDRVEGATLDQVRKPIRQLLVRERGVAAQERYVNILRAKTRVTITLDPLRETVADAGRPSRGPSGAPIQIVEFSDFQCPFCRQTVTTIDLVMKEYGDNVRLVYRHFPLPSHPDAWQAAEAAMCAADQDKFWQYHDRLFANQDRLAPDGLKQHAAEVGLDVAAFMVCLEGRKHQSAVQADLEAGQALGISGTPAFYINGRPLGGAQPFAAFKAIIDEELELARQGTK